MGETCSHCATSDNTEQTNTERPTKRAPPYVHHQESSSYSASSDIDTVEAELLQNKIDYSQDIGLKLHPLNTIDPISYEINKDLQCLRKLYPNRYSDLLKREFVKTPFYNKNVNDNSDNSNGDSFKIMTFNILSDILSGAYWPEAMEDKKAFLGIDKECLEWRYRGLRIIEEIIRSGADIICLQECDRAKFIDEYLSKLGFKYYFVNKEDSPITRRVGPAMVNARKKALNLSKNNNNAKSVENEQKNFTFNKDGCAIFYNSNKFEHNSKEIQTITTNMKNNKNEITAIAIKLKQKSNNKEFILVTTHLRSKKTYDGEIQRRNQIETMFGDLNNQNNEENNENNEFHISNPDNLPILLCLDMNAQPINNGEYDGLCYKYLTESLKFVSLCKEGYTDESDLNENESKVKERGERGKEPDYTTFKARIDGTVKHTIDYIFEKNNNSNDNKNSGSDGVWSVTEYFSIPETEKVIPDWFYPSDHFSLCLNLRWNDK